MYVYMICMFQRVYNDDAPASSRVPRPALYPSPDLRLRLCGCLTPDRLAYALCAFEPNRPAFPFASEYACVRVGVCRIILHYDRLQTGRRSGTPTLGARTGQGDLMEGRATGQWSRRSPLYGMLPRLRGDPIWIREPLTRNRV